MKKQFYTCDVFTDSAFGGNQLAVFPDAAGIPEELLQPIAREFNFSETTFVDAPTVAGATKKVRIFTPGGELPFAGHPTIGTAVTLARIGAIPMTGAATKIILEEKVGLVPVTIRATNGVADFAQLTAAKLPEFTHTVPSAETLAELLTIRREEIIDDRFPIEFVSVGFPFLYVAVKDRAVLGKIRINLPVMERVGLKEIFVFTTDAEAAGFDFRARMFAPLLGVTEDPATGSAAASFGGYLATKDPRTDGTLSWKVEQGVEMGRPSRLFIEADRSGGKTTAIRVAGSVVMMTEGTFDVQT